MIAVYLISTLKAEDELAEAGVTSDVGKDFEDDKVLSRDWELDWSLHGAEIKEK
ncbi:unnamed protein product [marine sediment metagenome]|uniref:Uncharacterized protein n=1 Tax=marine sediment metagenome TaxID=412755 RepID=X1THT5_9ZZZZ